jgi:hypothetical protein
MNIFHFFGAVVLFSAAFIYFGLKVATWLDNRAAKRSKVE